jgi:hypothetical protein
LQNARHDPTAMGYLLAAIMARWTMLAKREIMNK